MGYINLSPQEFKKKSDASANAVILDVRSPEEKVEGDIPGSVLINIMEADFPSQIERLDREKEYYIFCRSGGRSVSACEYMNNLGFSECYNLDGGIKAWNSEFGI